jgi:hypothetical protein
MYTYRPKTGQLYILNFRPFVNKTNALLYLQICFIVTFYCYMCSVLSILELKRTVNRRQKTNIFSSSRKGHSRRPSGNLYIKDEGTSHRVDRVLGFFSSRPHRDPPPPFPQARGSLPL